MTEENFRFKKFEIIQSESVHKVGTDGVLLGAWVAIQNAKKILDVGTGTGLIAIMLGQRTSGNAMVTAIDIDPTAFEIARRNIEKSEFSNCIELSHSRLQDFKVKNQFDLIVCNPPFFMNSLKPPAENRARQRHSDDLTFEEILTAITSLLSASGRLGLVLPVEEGKKFIDLAQNFGLNLSRQCNVFSKTGKNQERYLLEFSYRPTHLEKSSLTLMTANGDWTEEYQSLTREFYLNF